MRIAKPLLHRSIRRRERRPPSLRDVNRVDDQIVNDPPSTRVGRRSPSGGADPHLHMRPVLPSHGCHIPFAPTLFDAGGMLGPEACRALRLTAPPAAETLPLPREERLAASVPCAESQALQ